MLYIFINSTDHLRKSVARRDVGMIYHWIQKIVEWCTFEIKNPAFELFETFGTISCQIFWSRNRWQHDAFTRVVGLGYGRGNYWRRGNYWLTRHIGMHVKQISRNGWFWWIQISPIRPIRWLKLLIIDGLEGAQ